MHLSAETQSRTPAANVYGREFCTEFLLNATQPPANSPEEEEENPVTIPPPPPSTLPQGSASSTINGGGHSRRTAMPRTQYGPLVTPFLALGASATEAASDSAPSLSPASMSLQQVPLDEKCGPMRRKRGRPPVKKPLQCAECGTSNTPEWRRGKDGPNTLCNACGLQFSKRLRQEKEAKRRTNSIENVLNYPSGVNSTLNVIPTTVPASPTPHCTSSVPTPLNTNPPATSSPNDTPPSGSPSLLLSPLALKAEQAPSSLEPHELHNSILRAVANSSAALSLS